VVEAGGCLGDGALLLAGLDLLVDEEDDETDGDDEDDAEDDHDTSVLAGPVAALGDLEHSVASDNGEADGRHFGRLKVTKGTRELAMCCYGRNDSVKNVRD
jgi:hypothetical protein